MSSPGSLVSTTCIACGQHDNHPKHSISQGNVYVDWHNDCHARATGCVPCSAVAESGLKGDELRDHIVANNPSGKALAAADPTHDYAGREESVTDNG